MMRKALVAIVAILAAAPAAVAQRGVQRQVPVEPFKVLDSGGSIFLRGRFEQDKTNSGGFSQKNRETYFEEGIDVYSRGYAYHPNLAEWDASARAALFQDELKTNDGSRRTDGTLLGFNLSALLLKEQPVSFRPFASRSQDTQTRDFAEPVKATNQRFGMETSVKGKFPASLLLEHVTDELKSDFEDTDRRTNHLRFTVADQRNPDWLTQLVYDREDTDETSKFVTPGTAIQAKQDFPTKVDDVTVTNVWKFAQGGFDKHTLSGRARLLDRTGFFENREQLIEQTLDLSHTRTFSTFYRALLDNNETEGFKDRTAQGEAGFRKKVYESLDILGRGMATKHDFEGGDERIVGGFLDLDYRKRTPIGQYTSLLSLGLEREKDTSDGTRTFIGEPLALNGLAFVRIARPNVVPGTLVLSNLARNRIFVEGIDFQRRVIGAFTEIARIPGGAIADGEAIVADFTTTTTDELEFTTETIVWNNRLKLKDLPLSLYANYFLRDQNPEGNQRNNNTVAGQPLRNLDRIRDILLGIELNYKDLIVAYEHEDRDQILSPPTVADRVRASYRRALNDRVDASAQAQAERLRFREADEFGLEPGRDSLTTLGAALNVTAKLQRSTLLRFRSDYLRTSGQQNSRLFRNSVSLDWTYEKLDFSIEARHDIFEQETTDGTQDVLMFHVRRRF